MVDQAVKIDPLQAIRGDFPVYFEQSLGDEHSSIEIAVGFTRRNYLAGVFDYDEDNIARNILPRTGYSFKLAYRYYLKANPELDGWYISPITATRLYRRDFRELDEFGDLTGEEKVDSRWVGEAGVVFGGQHLSIFSNIFIDYYIGLGVQYKDFQIVKQEESMNGEVEYYTEDLNETGIAIFAGIKVGVGF